ncbi:iron-containing alcohol dehydrogenase [Paradesulfitobacterium ferrireducens]|uniref:iron-containing alcohol dehydrogenase n=1 Tax=Paradesulfitobacterium ferrireducens TaxID=2816476 RepID=UPI001A8C31C9|nr:iron-containing alcohol dehydrogenase [Paradesulfitobacterium ferrireducens]
MNFDKSVLFTLPTKIIWGYQTAEQTGAEAKKAGLTRVLVVTDSGIRKAGVLEPVLRSLEKAGLGYEIFDEVPEDPGTQVVAKGEEQLKSAFCNGIVIVGGGSPLCAGKAIALVATNGGNIKDYEGFEQFKKPPLPVIALPTTAGSGSEVSAALIITDEERNYKMTIGGWACHPTVAILDAMLLRTLPARQMIISGMDAVTHAVEAICTNLATPLTDAVAYEALRLMVENLPAAAYSDHLEAINFQLYGSAMANIACGNAKLGLVHALSQPLGSYHISHGLANGILLPYVMEYNLPVCEDKFARLALALGGGKKAGTKASLAREAIELIKELYTIVDFPDRLTEEIVPKSEIPRMAKIAMSRSQVKFNLRQARESELIEIFEQSYKGWR